MDAQSFPHIPSTCRLFLQAADSGSLATSLTSLFIPPESQGKHRFSLFTPRSPHLGGCVTSEPPCLPLLSPGTEPIQCILFVFVKHKDEGEGR
jgi:hypothetical protein